MVAPTLTQKLLINLWTVSRLTATFIGHSVRAVTRHRLSDDAPIQRIKRVAFRLFLRYRSRGTADHGYEPCHTYWRGVRDDETGRHHGVVLDGHAGASGWTTTLSDYVSIW